MAIPFTNIFHCKKLQNLPKFGFLVWKIYHLATLETSKHSKQACKINQFDAVNEAAAKKWSAAKFAFKCAATFETHSCTKDATRKCFFLISV
jgi:hypothetical protein